MAHLTLILGGARSGKSTYALGLAADPPHTFIATAQALDDEMEARIVRHRTERGSTWKLVEAPIDLASTIARLGCEGETLLVDCLTLWLSNVMQAGRDCATETEALLDALKAAGGQVVLVSNEVGMGLVPDNPLGRQFRDEQGRLNRRVAEAADRVEFIAAGLPLKLKG